MMSSMVDPLYRALVLAALGLAGCESTPATDAGAGSDTGEESDAPIDAPADVPSDTPVEDAGAEDAPCPADAELETPPCYLIL